MADLLIPNPSITSGAFTSMLAFSAGTDIITAISGHPIGGVGGGGGTPSEGYWRPLYNDSTGDLSWIWSIESTANAPAPANIAGPEGPQGPAGPSGASGAKGDDGFSPTVATASIPISTEFPAGGTEVTITDSVGSHIFNISNGLDGQGATVNLLGGEGIEVTKAGANYTISVSADYITKTYVDSASANALSEAELWVGQQGYLTAVPDSYATKAYANDASANAYNEAVAQIPDVTNFITKDVDNLTYYYKKTETSAASELTTEFANKVNKPDSSLVNKYLVLRTDGNGAVSGWCDFNDQSYSKSEADGRYVQQTFIDITLSGTGANANNKLGVNTNIIPTKDWLDDNYLPTSGGTVSGQLVVSGGSNFDQQFLKLIRENVNGYARLGLGQYGALALKVDDSNEHTTQLNVSPNATNDQLIQVQHNGSSIGYLIPATTSTTTAGLTNDGILHIILES